MTGDPLARVFGALHPAVRIEGSLGVAEFRPEPEHRGNPGWLHGGMAATLLDHVCARTAAAALGAPVVTAKLVLRYRLPVTLDGGPYRVEATAAEPRRRTVRVKGVLFDPAGRRLVEVEAMFVIRQASDG